ncbi:MAG: tail fiber protein [Clostridiales bacterium]|nr:tail fiber protein [Clostridiales bacterium]
MHNQAGSIQVWPGSTAPEGWLLCNGQAVSRTTYANLFSVLGTTYGQGDGSTTFNVPDLTGRVPMGTNGTYPLASKGGETAHTLSEEELPAVNGYLEFHNIYTGTNLADVKNAFSGEKISGKYRDGGTAGSGASSYVVVNLNFGQDGAHNNMQPYLAQHYIIKY